MRYKFRVRFIDGHGLCKEQDYYFFTHAGAKLFRWWLRVFRSRVGYIKKL